MADRSDTQGRRGHSSDGSILALHLSSSGVRRPAVRAGRLRNATVQAG
jgi:hypothetical protein